jgi:hypothetical protein
MNSPLRVTYDASLKFFMVSRSIWTATSPMQWFKEYRIISAMKDPLKGRIPSIDVADRPLSVRDMMTSPFLESVVAAHHLEDYTLLLNRPTDAPMHLKTLTNDNRLARQFENKVWFRERFSSELHFPEFCIDTLETLLQKGLNYYQTQLSSDALVIQHPALGGGRGTYYIDTQETFDACIESLSSLLSTTDRIVVSRRLERPRERTIQACVTGDTVLIGPAQSQLVGHPLLTSSRQGDFQFCGGRIATDLLAFDQYEEVRRAATIVGEHLKREGYRGIFGMDFMTSGDEVFVLEVNPRMTSLSTLLAFLQQEIPFMLIHILELAHSAYTVQVALGYDSAIHGSFIQVYMQQAGTSHCETGLYNTNGVRIGDGFKDGSILPQDEDSFFVAMRISPGQQTKQGKSVAFIYSRTQLFNDEGVLNLAVLPVIEVIRR